MRPVPKFVTDRLRAAESRTNHPDPDVLTAFAEQSLTEGERAGVLGHLARCADCREIVALALPEIDAVQKILQPSRATWLTWPALRWVFVAAGVVAIASFGVVRYGNNSRTMDRLAASNLREPAASKEAKNAIPPPPAAQPTATTTSDKVPSNRVFKSAPTGEPMSFDGENLTGKQQTALAVLPQRKQAEKDSAKSFHGYVANGSLGGPLAGTNQGLSIQQQQGIAQTAAPSAPPQIQLNKQASASARIAPPPSATQTVEVSGAAPIVQTEVAELKKENSGPQGAAAQSAQYDAPVGKAKPADIAGEQRAAAVPMAVTADSNAVATPVTNLPINGRDVTSLATLSSANAPRWTINSKGVLQRSFDQGKSWQDVVVVANLGSVVGGLLSRQESSSEEEHAKSRSADKKSRLDRPQVFRALAVNGVEVWAGGSNTLLYHSLDAGDHWTQVLPASSGAVLTGDVLTVDFPDPQHGKITTSTGEVWNTTDAGRTWQKQ